MDNEELVTDTVVLVAVADPLNAGIVQLESVYMETVSPDCTPLIRIVGVSSLAGEVVGLSKLKSVGDVGAIVSFVKVIPLDVVSLLAKSVSTAVNVCSPCKNTVELTVPLKTLPIQAPPVVEMGLPSNFTKTNCPASEQVPLIVNVTELFAILI